MTTDPLAEQRAVNRYAYAIAKLPTREKRASELAKVPEKYRELVQKVVTSIFINRKTESRT